MRFCYYKLVKDLCGSLIEAVSYMFNSGDMSLWPVCTDAVNTIEQTLSANSDSVSSEGIFDICKGLKENIILCQNGQDRGQELVDDITALVSECETGLRYRLRVLFVADLGGKWDSMDSVYHAFKKRDDCDVDVVVQPIFRQHTGADGTQRTEIICEDYLAPMGIKTIPYKDYDMEKIAPDITFISQPYESVTIPMFWPENIAKVSRLVYLPYFNAITIDSNISTAFNSLLKMNVQKYSWKIPCNSNQMHEHYKKYASEEGKNVLVSGVPKCDYPLKLNKDNTPCPNKWKNAIKDRKVFLWNTHFNSDYQGIKILSEGCSFLEKIAKDKRIALIWRPHPMTEAVIKVYLHDKLGVYRRMQKIAADSDNIIIDKNSTYDASFVWSDALISDYSTLAEQYMLMDKPVIYTSTENSVNTKLKYNTNDGLFDFSKVHWAYSVSDINNFIDDICHGNDKYAEARKYLIDTYYPLSDGNAGERLTQMLIKEFEEML